MRRAYIEKIEYYVPENYEANAPEDTITAKIGIAKRHIAKANEYASDLGVKAANKLFNANDIERNQIDMLIYCTQSPDYILPTTACLLHESLNLPKECAAFDINLGCSGYVYGLSIAKSFIESGIVNNVLFITSDTYSKYINNRDRSVKVLFGDGASATLVSCMDSDQELIGPFVFGTDGTGKDNLIIKSGGLRDPITSKSNIEERDSFGNYRSGRNLFMNGPDVFNFSLREVPSTIRSLLDKSGNTLEDYDHFVFHQANRFMLEKLRKVIKIPLEKFSYNLENIGNTVSSSIPISIYEDFSNGKIKVGDQLMLVGFGVGYSWAACNIIMV
ncbi:ketoacyl-ACP synthase III [Paenibacillus polymyxa]|nr:ketoacyl-ACP synthase III [Paenibacillus polymyxa]MDY7991539.1 ketoacyl-ACP synthase III [Paenibacillus polymyxa]MDY8117980.1 ketoacyl-ACP synthase III [Paenibacillus polymyxa]